MLGMGADWKEKAAEDGQTGKGGCRRCSAIKPWIRGGEEGNEGCLPDFLDSVVLFVFLRQSLSR